MTDSPSPASAAKAKTSKPDAEVKGKAPAKKPAKPKGSFLVENIPVDVVDEVAERTRIKRVFRVIQMQIVIIAALSAFLIVGSPLFKTVYFYFAIDSSAASRHPTRLTFLTAPNLTNQAVLSWSTNSITEIMTFGFGDYLAHLRAQKARFTPGGWTSFVNAFDKMKLGEVFRERQLVLTTVPSDSAVIVRQGPTADHRGYEWEVQMPVVMTYATNDNITHRDHAVIDLKLSRVPPTENPNGLAIRNWTVS